MSGRLTTHVLDISRGKPAEGMILELWRCGEDAALLHTAVTNRDGRVDSPLLQGENVRIGLYEIRFHVGDFFRGICSLEEPSFLEMVPVRFQITDPTGHYHVPLLVAPGGYSTYRGS